MMSTIRLMMTKHAGGDEDDPLDDGEVLHADRLEHVLADAGQREDLLDDERAAEQVAERDPDDRDRRTQRVLQRVLADHLAGSEALRHRGAHVVLVQGVDERPPDLTGDRGRAADSERHPGKDQVLEPLPGRRRERHVAEGREEVQVDGEGDDEQQGEPEVRDGHAQAAADGDQPVRRGALTDARDDARRDADDHRDHHPADGQGERDREPLLDPRGDALVLEQRRAEVPMDDLVEPAQVLLPERLVQVELVGDARHLGRVRVDAPGQDQRRVPGQEEHQAEHTEGDQEQERNGDQQPAADEGEERAS